MNNWSVTFKTKYNFKMGLHFECYNFNAVRTLIAAVPHSGDIYKDGI